jgi:hypothetical protein
MLYGVDKKEAYGIIKALWGRLFAISVLGEKLWDN